MPKVSVIIPCYNAQKYIGQCIDSLLCQTLSDFEIICVDDGSTDETPVILKGYAERDSRVKVLEQKNLYAGVARNKGLAAAEGEYVIFLDGDDFFAENMLETACRAADEKEADAVIFGFRRFDDKKQIFFPKDENPRIDLIPDTDVFCAKDIPDDIFRITSPAPWTKLFRRSFVEKTGLQFQELPNSNDFFFILSALSMAERICAVGEALTFYRVNMATSIQGSKHKNPLCFLEAIDALYAQLNKTGLYGILEKAFQTVALSSAHYNLRSASTDKARMAVLEALGSSGNSVNALLGHEEEYYSNAGSFKHAATINSAVEQYRNIKNTKQKADTLPVIPYRSENKPAVSVIIPVYNTGDYLHATLESICNQSLKEIEIICINDGSTDDSLDILKGWAEKDSRISLWTQENAGLSCTRNSGVKIAQGKYVYFMDSDDILESDALELLCKKAEADNLDVVYFDADVFCEEEELEDHVEKYNYKRSKEYSEVYEGQELFKTLYNNGEYFPSACLQMLRKDFIEELGLSFHPGIIHEDNAFTFTAIINAQRASHINRPFFRRRLRGNSIMTTTVSFKNAYGYFVSYKDMMRAYIKAEDKLTEENREAALTRIGQNLLNAQNSYANMPKEQLGAELGLIGDRRSFERMVVRAGNAYRQCEELKDRNQQDKRKLTEKNKKVTQNYEKLKVNHKKLNKRYKKLKKRDKRIRRTRLQRFIICCWDHSFSYAVKLSLKKLFGKLSGGKK